MKTLIKTLECADCEIFAVKNHRRHFIAKAVPTIEIYQNSSPVSTLGGPKSQYKTYDFSVIICPDPELEKDTKLDFLDGISHFDIKMLIKRKDGVFVPFDFAGLTDFEIDELDEWIFNVNNLDRTKELIAF